MNVLYPTLGALVLLAVFTFFVGRQNRDLLRVRAYREFGSRLIPALTTGVFVAGLPFIMQQATFRETIPTLLVYVGGAAVLILLSARSVSPEERRASLALRKEDPENAVTLFEDLVSQKPLPRHYSALGAALDASGDPYNALNATNRALKLDPMLATAYYNRASAHASLGDNERAREDLQRVFTSEPGRSLRRAATEALEML